MIQICGKCGTKWECTGKHSRICITMRGCWCETCFPRDEKDNYPECFPAEIVKETVVFT